MLPSPRMIIMVLAAAPLFLGGVLFSPLTAMGIAYLLGLLAWASLEAFLTPGRGKVTVARRVPVRFSLNEPAQVVYGVHNRSRRKVQVALAEAVPETMEAAPEIVGATLEPGEETAIECRLTATRRGRHTLEAVDVRVLPVRGLLIRQFRLALPAQIDVFPDLVNVGRYELMLRRGLTREQGLARMRQIGQGSQFESLRLYGPGDEMSKVDWKATARRAELIVRNYEPERQQSVLVALDVGRATAGEFGGLSRLDYLVNATLMLAYVALRQVDWFSLCAFSDRIESYLPPLRQVKNIDRVARALYRLEPHLTESDYAAACRFMALKNRKRSLVCLMTDVIDRQASSIVISYMARFARHHLPLAVTLANPEVAAVAGRALSDGADPYVQAVALDVQAAREEALTAMRHHGVDVLDVEPRQLTIELVNRYLAIKAAHRL
jgi:uncharacterized protein (DUF58 family)